MDAPKDCKRKNTGTDADEKSQTEKKRRKKDTKVDRPKHYPLSERQQLAMLMQMTAKENCEQNSTTPPSVKKSVGGSGKKDKVNKRNERGETPLHLATIRGELPAIMELVKQGADVNVQDYAGWTPLHEACNHGYQDIAKFLLEAGAIVNTKGFNDDYPLHDAVNNEHVELVELLLKHGANPLLANRRGERPLDLAENDEIKLMMQREILSSDESDQNDSKVDGNDQDERTETYVPSSQKPKLLESTSDCNRELFKQFETDTYKDSSTSSDSDDSDNIPLSRRRSSSFQSVPKSNVTSTHISTNDRKLSSSGFLETKRGKFNNKRRLFSTDSSGSVDSDTKLSRHFQFPNNKDDLVSHNFKANEKSSLSTDESLLEKKVISSKKTNVFLSSPKPDEPDVYDFSPNSDDFSSENTPIILKPDNRSPLKWENQTKQHGLFSRKSSTLFASTKTYETGSKKLRKTSKEQLKISNDLSPVKETSKSVLIKPVYETSEMLFDRIFKSPQKTEDNNFSFGSVTKTPTSIYSASPSLPSNNTSTVQSAFTSSNLNKKNEQKVLTTISIPSTTTDRTCIETQNIAVTTVTTTTKQQFTSQHKTRQESTTDSLKNIFTDVIEKSLNQSSTTSDDAQILSNQVEPLTSVNKDFDELSHRTWRSETTNQPLIETSSKASLEVSKDQKPELLSSESKILKKHKTDLIKDKLNKTLSDPSKKLKIKPPSKDSRTTSSTPNKKVSSNKTKVSIFSTKKEKEDPKRSNIFGSKPVKLSTSNKTSPQLQTKAQQRKKTKSLISLKPEDKKQTKKPEVKLIDTDSWLGSPSEKNQAERQKRTSQKSVKRSLDVVTDVNRTPITTTTLSVIEVSSTSTHVPSLSKFVSVTSTQPSLSKLVSTTSTQVPYSSKLVSTTPTQVPSVSKFASVISTQVPSLSKLVSATSTPVPSLLKLVSSTSTPVPSLSKPVSASLIPTKGVEEVDTLPEKKPIPLQTVVTANHSENAVNNSEKLNVPYAVSDSSFLSPSTQFTNQEIQSSPKANFPIQPLSIIIDTSQESPSTSLTDLAHPDPIEPELTSHDEEVEVKNIDKEISIDAEQDSTLVCEETVAPVSELSKIEQTNDKVDDDHDVEEVSEKEAENPLSEHEESLRAYIKQRLAAAKIELSRTEPLRNRIPMQVLLARKKDPAVDKLNVIEERLAIQRRIFDKRKKFMSVIPQAPECYWEYMTFTGGYLLNGSRDSRLSVPVLAAPSSLCQPMIELFKIHEEKRVRLRVQHAIEREKLIISCEQEILRVYSRAARTNQNQSTPFSACAVLMDCEVYNMPRQHGDGESGKTSIRDRFNTRMFLSWLQDVDDKFVKIKSVLLARQRHEAAALNAVQKTEWILKCQELDRSQRTLKPNEINQIYVPIVNIADDFDLLPA